MSRCVFFWIYCVYPTSYKGTGYMQKEMPLTFPKFRSTRRCHWYGIQHGRNLSYMYSRIPGGMVQLNFLRFCDTSDISNLLCPSMNTVDSCVVWTLLRNTSFPLSKIIWLGMHSSFSKIHGFKDEEWRWRTYQGKPSKKFRIVWLNALAHIP